MRWLGRIVNQTLDSNELGIGASERELLQIEIASNKESIENWEIENKPGEELKDIER